MKRLAILTVFVFFAFVAVRAQSSSQKPTVTPSQVLDVTPAKDASTANQAEKKDNKHCSDKKENKGCGDVKTESKKSCCAHKKTEAKKEENQ